MNNKNYKPLEIRVDLPRIKSPYLLPREAAKYVRSTPGTLEVYRSRGGGPKFRKRGTRILYHLSDLDDWIKAAK
jgi:hypothetical protein